MSYNPYISLVATFPGVLDTASNASMARLSPLSPVEVTKLEVDVETAPTGAAIIVDFKVGTRSTGVVGSSIGTVTVAIDAFTASTVITPAALGTNRFLIAEITQVGSTIAGSNATITARARAA